MTDPYGNLACRAMRVRRRLKAYKKMAIRHHPDRGGDERKFQEITNAYHVLRKPMPRDAFETYSGCWNIQFVFRRGASAAAV